MAAHNDPARLKSLQEQDPNVEEVIYYSKFAVAYVLEQEGQTPGWRKANIEGPVSLVRRSVSPRFQLQVKNQFSTNDLADKLHENWELDCQKNYVFYKVEDSKKQIRGLWFHDDAERQKCEAALEKTLNELRNKTKQAYTPGPQVEAPKADAGQMDSLYAQFGLAKDGPQGLGQPAPVEAPMASAVDQARQASGGDPLQAMQAEDPYVDAIVYNAKFAVAYLLQQDGPSPGWRKANIEGPVYLLRRKNNPRYKLMVKNQFSTNDLMDNLHPEWELDCQKNYVFYKVEDTAKQIRGLWFHDDTERQKCEAQLEKALQEIRSRPQGQQQAEAPKMDGPQYEGFGLQKPPEEAVGLAGYAPPAQGRGAAGPAGSVVVTPEVLRASFHELADDDRFVNMIMQQLRKAS